MPPENNEQDLGGFYDEIYRDTREYYKKIQPKLGENDCGFKILNGPPHLRPPVLFLGYQPGGGIEHRDRYQNAHHVWPGQLEYVTEEWELAEKVQDIFDYQGLREMLPKCVALNAIFFRAPDIQTWSALSPDLRKNVLQFCLPRVKSIINAVQPRLIIVNGLATAKLFGGDVEVDLRSPKERTLTKTCTIENNPALATLHLSGARISTSDRELLYDRVRSKIKSKNPDIS